MARESKKGTCRVGFLNRWEIIFKIDGNLSIEWGGNFLTGIFGGRKIKSDSRRVVGRGKVEDQSGAMHGFRRPGTKK